MEMDVLNPSSSVPLSVQFDEFTHEKPRSKTSLRMVYEAQVSVIQKQIGDLEKVRTDLGLSQRKMCQLLMVDPSAWTRWTRGQQNPPPHIWRALQWYLTLQEKIPGLTSQYFIGKDPQILHEKTMRDLDDVKAGFSERYLRLHQEMQREVKFHRRISYFMSGMTLVLAAVLVTHFFMN